MRLRREGVRGKRSRPYGLGELSIEELAAVDQQAVRTRLEQMLRDLDAASETLRGEHAGDSAELSHIDQHPGDTGSEISDADRQVALLEANGRQREQVQAALARLDAGTYGTCVDCGRAIPETRLDARPEAARDIDCQAKADAAA